jgi:RNA polymerase sigma-70 factor (ECF subfamily)
MDTEGVHNEITGLLFRIQEGDEKARSRLADLVYGDLRRVARRLMRAERSGHTLQPTALVNEVFLRLFDGPVTSRNRAHFFAIAAAMMRRVLVDHARAHRAGKRTGHATRIELDEVLVYAEQRSDELLSLDNALAHLGKVDARQSSIVELRFFGGLDEAEIAVLLGISMRTVKRDWSVAKAWLNAEMRK